MLLLLARASVSVLQLPVVGLVTARLSGQENQNQVHLTMMPAIRRISFRRVIHFKLIGHGFVGKCRKRSDHRKRHTCLATHATTASPTRIMYVYVL